MLWCIQRWNILSPNVQHFVSYWKCYMLQENYTNAYSAVKTDCKCQTGLIHYRSQNIAVRVLHVVPSLTCQARSVFSNTATWSWIETTQNSVWESVFDKQTPAQKTYIVTSVAWDFKNCWLPKHLTILCKKYWHEYTDMFAPSTILNWFSYWKQQTL